MLTELRPAIVLAVLLTAITGLAYPLGMSGLARLAVSKSGATEASSSANGAPVGSSLIGQVFTSDRYFHGRPSATTAADPNDPSKTVSAPYNAANSGAANLGPTNQALIERVKEDLERAKAGNGSAPVPIDLVTTSASGLDPDISPQGALFQVPRIARARGLPEDRVSRLVNEHTQGRILGFLGDPRVNVLALNLALDRLTP